MRRLVAGKYKKMKTLIIRVVYPIVFLSCCSTIYGQIGEIANKADSGCFSSVNGADRLFQEGRYDMCIIVLEDVLKDCHFSKNERISAMELLAKAYLETDDPAKAEMAVNQMLHYYPLYELKEKYNSESFNRLVRKYNIHPRLSLGIRNTLDWVNYKTTTIYSFNGISYDVPYTKRLQGIANGFGWMYYGWGELQFDCGISLNGEFIFKWTNFVREIDAPSFLVTFREQDNYLETPVYLKKYFTAGKYLLPYIAAGAGWLHLMEADGNATIDYQDDTPTFSSGDLNMLEMRNTNTIELIGGIGLGYKLKNLRIFVDARWYRGLKSITIPEKVSASYLFNDYAYLDNPMRLNQFELGASLSYTFINSVKRKGK